MVGVIVPIGEPIGAGILTGATHGTLIPIIPGILTPITGAILTGPMGIMTIGITPTTMETLTMGDIIMADIAVAV